MTDQVTTELVAAEPTPRAHAHMMAISQRSGVIAYSNMADVIESAKLMSQAGFAVRKHFRGNPGACMAVIQQALRWGMDAYAVANRSYFVNDQLAFESSVLQSVILVNAPIKGRIKHEFKGEGPDRRCRVWAELRDEPSEIVEYTSPRFADIKPKNSPLWTGDPDQQHFYWSGRSFCRRHFPEILLGVVDREEADFAEGEFRDITPRESMTDKLDRIAAPATASPAKPAEPEPAKAARRPRGWPEAFSAASFVIEEGMITKHPDGLTGGASEQDEAQADLILEGNKIVKQVARKPEPTPKINDAERDAAEARNEHEREPVKVTSGKPDHDPVANERATQQEIASAAGALDPQDDPFKDEVVEEKVDPLRVAVDKFKVDLVKVTNESELEAQRKAFMKDFKGVPNDNPIYIEAAGAYRATVERIRSGGEAPKEEVKPQPEKSKGELTAMTPAEEDEHERIITHELDHAPRGIDTNDISQLRAYVQGLKAVEKGRAIGAVPAVYSDVERAAWETAHRFAVERKKAGEG